MVSSDPCLIEVSPKKPTMPNANLEPQREQALSCYDILRIAHQDALRAYGDLARFRITLALESDRWHIDYDVTEPFMAGGGPHYVIDEVTGAILSKRYEQ
jgi:hypothetical protein